MATTRAKASQLLTAAELTLFDAGAASAARNLDATTLRGHITRARALRDKARDQLKRQRLASRERSGSKLGRSGAANARTQEKAELLAEVLKRLQAQRTRLKPAKKKTAAKKVATKKKAAPKKTAAKKTTAKKTATRKAVAKKPVAKKAAAAKTTAKKAAAKKTAAKRSAKKATAKNAETVKSTAARKNVARPGKAFSAPNRSAKAPVPMEPQGTSQTATASTGFVSRRARSAAQERHFEESRNRAIQAHISSRGRRNQGKRDSRDS